MNNNYNNPRRDFHYQFLSSNISVSLKKTLGVHLFKIRHGRKIPASKVCSDLNIKSDTLDRVEIGKGHTAWNIITQLFKYYNVRIHISLENNILLKEPNTIKNKNIS